MQDYEAIVERLRDIEEQLRELAFERLQDAAREGRPDSAEERRIQRARRGITKAITELGGNDSGFLD